MAQSNGEIMNDDDDDEIKVWAIVLVIAILGFLAIVGVVIFIYIRERKQQKNTKPSDIDVLYPKNRQVSEVVDLKTITTTTMTDAAGISAIGDDRT